MALVGGMLAANRQNQLNEARNYVFLVAGLRLRPQHRLRLIAKRKLRRGNVNAEVDVADDASAVKRAKQILCNAILQFLLTQR